MKGFNSKVLVLVMLFAAAVMFTTAAPASAAKITIRAGHPASPGHLIDVALNKYKELVEKRTDSAVEVKTYPSSQLGTQTEMIQGVTMGTLEMTIGGSATVSAEKKLAVFEFPFFLPDRKIVEKFVRSPIKTELQADLLKKDLVLLAIWENGYRHITNNKKPIVVPDDLKGLKIRTPKSPSRVLMFKTWGADPSPMSFGELFSALQQGVMDGQENPFTDIYAGKLYEVQKYLSISNHVYSPTYLLVGKSFWDKLPPDIRKVLKETGEEMENYCWELGEKMDKELLVKLEEKMKVNTCDVKAFQEASKPVYEQLQEMIGADFFQRASDVLGK